MTWKAKALTEAEIIERYGKHSEEVAEKRGIWFRWHDGSNVGSIPGFYYGGKAQALS